MDKFMETSAETDKQPEEEKIILAEPETDAADPVAAAAESAAEAAEPLTEAVESAAEAVEPEAELAVAATAINEKPPTKPSSRRVRTPQKAGGRRSGKNQPTVRLVTDHFAACARCSYFWAGYRVLFGEDAQATAVAQSESGWLDLEWNLEMPDLLHKSYGIRLDVAHYHYEGCCKECRRRFIYQAAGNEDEANSCAIEISPHKTSY
jgi:hypothetical protein